MRLSENPYSLILYTVFEPDVVKNGNAVINPHVEL